MLEPIQPVWDPSVGLRKDQGSFGKILLDGNRSSYADRRRKRGPEAELLQQLDRNCVRQALLRGTGFLPLPGQVAGCSGLVQQG